MIKFYMLWLINKRIAIAQGAPEKSLPKKMQEKGSECTWKRV